MKGVVLAFAAVVMPEKAALLHAASEQLRSRSGSTAPVALSRIASLGSRAVPGYTTRAPSRWRRHAPLLVSLGGALALVGAALLGLLALGGGP